MKNVNIINSNKNSTNRGESENIDEISNSLRNDISSLIYLRKGFSKNPILSYLNINSLGGKFHNLREFCFKTEVDILCIDETKIDPSYPDSQFHIDGYQFPHFVKIETKDSCNYSSGLCDTFSLTNIVNGKTCFKVQKGTSIDVLLTNRPRSFHKTGIFEIGFSDHHKLVLSVFRSYFIRIPPKTIEYRNYKNFNETAFICDLDQELLKGEM